MDDSEVPGNRSWYRKPSFWFGLCNLGLGAVALAFGILGYCQSDEALEWQKDQSVLSAKRLEMSIILSPDSLYLSSFRAERIPFKHGDWWLEGLKIFVKTKLFNNGPLPISIDEVRSVSLVDRTHVGIIRDCVELDRVTPVGFPLVIDPFVQRDLLVPILWRIDSSMQCLFENHPDSSFVAFDEVIERWNAYSHFRILLPEGPEPFSEGKYHYPFHEIMVNRNPIYSNREVVTRIVADLSNEEISSDRWNFSLADSSAIGVTDGPCSTEYEDTQSDTVRFGW